MATFDEAGIDREAQPTGQRMAANHPVASPEV
jgi:hypothetical protein